MCSLPATLYDARLPQKPESREQSCNLTPHRPKFSPKHEQRQVKRARAIHRQIQTHYTTCGFKPDVTFAFGLALCNVGNSQTSVMKVKFKTMRIQETLEGLSRKTRGSGRRVCQIVGRRKNSCGGTSSRVSTPRKFVSAVGTINDGTEAGARAGYSVDLSRDGSILAVGARAMVELGRNRSRVRAQRGT